jgi:hypothetical protein
VHRIRLHRHRLATRASALLLGMASLTLGTADAAEPVVRGQTPDSHWWSKFYFHSDGAPRWYHGMFHNTRDHKYRVPVCPPLYGGAHGYYQPCWRQLDVFPRCVTCEYLPQQQVDYTAPPYQVPPPAAPLPGETPPTAPPQPGSPQPAPPTRPYEATTTLAPLGTIVD